MSLPKGRPVSSQRCAHGSHFGAPIRLRWRFALGLALALTAGLTTAVELRLGLAQLPSSLDPHHEDRLANNAVLSHIYDTLVVQDENQGLAPGLAHTWQALSATQWEFKLRPAVRFHDDSQFDADDVRYSFERALRMDAKGLGFSSYLEGLEVTVVDPLTVHIRTQTPHVLLPRDLSQVFIVSRKGDVKVGTGRYYPQPSGGSRGFLLKRFERYWGSKPEWTGAVMRVIPSADERIAALLAGEVDLIDAVPPAGVARIARSPGHVVTRRVSNRLMYLQLDQFRTSSVYVRKQAGQAGENGLRDARVRRAMSLAIDRDGLILGALGGAGDRAGQFLPNKVAGQDHQIEPHPYDPEAARALLRDAGYGEGFRLTLHLPRTRYASAVAVANSLARMWRDVGIELNVERIDDNEYFKRASRGGIAGTPEFSLLLLRWHARSGEALNALSALVHSFDLKAGLGLGNRGRYTNTEADALIEQARVNFNPVERALLSVRATRVAINQTAMIPLYFELNAWAARKGLRYAGRIDARTLAYSAFSE